MSDIQAWLARIGLKHRPEPTLDGLASVQSAHLRHVPFENIDVFTGIPLSLDTSDLFNKIVRRQRGGYCFEINTLLAAMLCKLDFAVTPILASVWIGAETNPPPLNHLLLKVHIDGVDYISDAGFGIWAPLFPYRLACGEFDDFMGNRLILEETEEYGFTLSREKDQDWEKLYSFRCAAATSDDIEAANRLTEFGEKSNFRKYLFAGRFRKDGRCGLRSTHLTLTGKEEMAETVEPSKIRGILIQHFGLDLDDQAATLLSNRLNAEN